jgi:hypothetical protein
MLYFVEKIYVKTIQFLLTMEMSLTPLPLQANIWKASKYALQREK